MPLTYPHPGISFRHIPTRTDEVQEVERASLFKSNRSQAVRLPKAVAYPDSVKQVDIVAIGRVRLITPAGESWDAWFDEPGVTEDFMSNREQPLSGQEREPL